MPRSRDRTEDRRVRVKPTWAPGENLTPISLITLTTSSQYLAATFGPWPGSGLLRSGYIWVIVLPVKDYFAPHQLP